MPMVAPPAVSFPALPRASPGQLGPFAAPPRPLPLPQLVRIPLVPSQALPFSDCILSPCLPGRQADRWTLASVG